MHANDYIGQTLYKDEEDTHNVLHECIIWEASLLWAKAPIEGSDYRDGIMLDVSKINFLPLGGRPVFLCIYGYLWVCLLENLESGSL